MSSVRAATLVAALSFSLVRGGVPRSWKSPWPGCDNGKLLIQMDLPRNALWACPATSWPEATQSYPGVDTVYDPEPAKQVCMGTPISYNLNIPNSGPYRPVGAESGEYLYCPAERWLNNLHHGATVLLYHPCAPLSERVRLSVLARSCLSDYIITPHPELEHTRVALVSWGRTLELSTIHTLAVCDWLEEVEAAAKGTNPNDVVATRNYSLLLIRPAEQNALPAKQSHANTMLSIRHCCEKSLFNPLVQGEEARWQGGGGGGGGRRPRGAIKKSEKTETTTKHETSPSKSTQTLQASRASQSEPNPGLVKPGPEPPRPGSRGRPATTVLGSVLAKTTMAGRGGSDVKVTVEHRDRGSAGQNSAEQKLLTDLPDRTVKNGERVAMKQSREPKLTHPVGIEDKNIETPPKAPPPLPNAHHRASTPTPTAPEDIVDPDGHIAAGVLGGKGRTPRTDEAVWAAGALGFLMVLLALSVLHTRLYRQWRTTPPMYWHDPRQDYDSVADVIRKRLKIADRRHRRKSYQPRTQECLLLPSSDEEDDDQ